MSSEDCVGVYTQLIDSHSHTPVIFIEPVRGENDLNHSYAVFTSQTVIMSNWVGKPVLVSHQLCSNISRLVKKDTEVTKNNWSNSYIKMKSNINTIASVQVVYESLDK